MFVKERSESSFTECIYQLVAEIPRGRVATYGYIAAVCGRPRAARIVGGVAHYGPAKLPWHRVVKKDGYMAEGFPGGVAAQQSLLEAEGIEFTQAGTIKRMREVHI